MRYLMYFSYDGSGYKGYQKQVKSKTVQAEIENVLKKINSNKKVSIHASGRTDAGVHAINQAAHFDMDTNMSLDKIRVAMNRLLPNDIYIKKTETVDNDFHARYNVKKKEYLYVINMGEYNPMERNYVFQYNKKLDLSEIKRAIKYIEGERDFTSFTSLDKTEKDKNCIRTLSKITLHEDGDKLELTFIGDGFLKYMVRNIVGTLIEIGEGKKKSHDIITILESKDRKKAGKTANPEGLYLKGVYY